MLTFISASVALAFGLAASTVVALPARRSASSEISDVTILNFALTLEHLENAFYKEGLAKFDDAAFAACGLPEFARGRMVQIGENEQIHVTTLSDALGPDATQPCEYNFPLTDVQSFIDLSAVLEGVGTAAYTGAASLLSDPSHITDAASILATEARQASWVMSAVKKLNPFSTSFETPLDLNQAFTLASGFITSCPSSNPSLPVRAFSALNVTSSTGAVDYTAGDSVTVSFNDAATAAANGTSPFLALLTGLRQLFVPLTSNGDGGWSAILPSELKGTGTVYALVTSNNTSANDDNTIAGVAILQFPFGSHAHVVN